MSLSNCSDDTRESTSVLMQNVSPRQAIAASLLVSGKQGREVAASVGVTPETVSRWRHQPAFQSFMHQLLREHVASLQLSMIALTDEAVTHLRYLVNGFSDEISLKACAVALSRAAPVITAIGQELRESSAERVGPTP
jgi:transposase-like protein